MNVTRPILATGLVVATLGAVTTLARGDARTWSFQGDALGAPPAGFSFARTGDGGAGKWEVRLDPTSPGRDHVLAQVEADRTDYRFPVAVADAPLLQDLRLDVRCKSVSGRVDQACGLVFRYRDAGNYYVARANALEDNVNLYRVVDGQRRQIQGWRGKVPSGQWHALAVEARGTSLRVFWEGRQVINAADDTFKEAGRVGVWTKADSVTFFDALSVTALP